MTKPRLPDAPQTSPDSTVLTVGTDLVHIPGFSAQLEQPGTVFAQRAFTARELREAQRRAQEWGTTPAQHLAARWAAKESFIKAWSQATFCAQKVAGRAHLRLSWLRTSTGVRSRLSPIGGAGLPYA